MLLYTNYTTPLGSALLASDGAALTGLWLAGQKYAPAGLEAKAVFAPEHPLFRRTEDWLHAYFAGERPDPDALPLNPQGTPFQRRVWALLRAIPYGQTVTYGQLAQELGKTMAAQAVGQAVGHNPILLVIPCHRVVGIKGSLTGYAAGMERKRWLLEHEGAL